MKPGLVDSTGKEKERERQMQENVEVGRGNAQKPEEEDAPIISSIPKAKNQDIDLIRDCPAEVMLTKTPNEHLIKDFETCTNQKQPQTFYIFDPRNNTYKPAMIVRSENITLECIDSPKEVHMPVTDDHIRVGSGIALGTCRSSVIKKLKTNRYEDLINPKEKSIYHLEDKSNVPEEDHIDIEKIIDICFAEEIDKNEDCKSNYCSSNQEKRQRKVPPLSSVLPFKKRCTDHQFEFLSTAIQNNLTLASAFTFEEEFRLHDFVVRRDFVNEEIMKYMCQKSPMIMKSTFDKFSESLHKKSKIHHTETQFEFWMKCSNEFGIFVVTLSFILLLFVILASSKCQEVFDEFKGLDNSLAIKYASFKMFVQKTSSFYQMFLLLHSGHHLLGNGYE